MACIHQRPEVTDEQGAEQGGDVQAVGEQLDLGRRAFVMGKADPEEQVR
jgi:hypothetical protein